MCAYFVNSGVKCHHMCEDKCICAFTANDLNWTHFGSGGERINHVAVGKYVGMAKQPSLTRHCCCNQSLLLPSPTPTFNRSVLQH